MNCDFFAEQLARILIEQSKVSPIGDYKKIFNKRRGPSIKKKTPILLPTIVDTTIPATYT